MKQRTKVLIVVAACLLTISIVFLCIFFNRVDRLPEPQPEKEPFAFSEAVTCVKRASSDELPPRGITRMEGFGSRGTYFFQISFGAKTVYYASNIVFPINSAAYSAFLSQARGQASAEGAYFGTSYDVNVHVYSSAELEKIIAAAEAESYE